MYADLQMVNMSLRILSKPDEPRLPHIFKVRLPSGWSQLGARFCGRACGDVVLHALGLPSQTLGMDWEERVLPSIGNEVVKAVVAQYNAEQLITQRERVSRSVSAPGDGRRVGPGPWVGAASGCTAVSQQHSSRKAIICSGFSLATAGAYGLARSSTSRAVGPAT